jgi:hypothetical protein
MDADPRAFFRAEPPLDLRSRKVTVLGCGSVGGALAWIAGSAGFSVLTLADRDTLKPANLRRHVCGAEQLGQPKAAAVAALLGDRFPTLHTRVSVCDFLEQPDRLRELIAPADLVFTAVDDEAPKHLLDAMARELGKPVVYAGVYGGGWAGEVVRVRPGRGQPCYACCAGALGRAGIDLEPSLTPQRNGYALTSPHRTADAWATADLGSIWPSAALAVHVGLAHLAAVQSPGRTAEFEKASAWRLALRFVPAWNRGPWQCWPVDVPAAPGCPNCGENIPESCVLPLEEGDD